MNDTIAILKRSCYFKKIQEKVRKYIKRCEHCQKNKHATHKKYGGTKVIPLPEHPWQEITIDFITKLSKSKDSVIRIQYNSIWVVIDRLTKWAHMILFKETFNVEQLTHLYLDRIIRYHRYPDSIISDRDKLFRSAYWRTL